MDMLSLIRRGSALVCGPDAYRCYCALTVGQPLILAREPQNPADRRAIRCHTMTYQPCGYLAREDAAFLAPRMDAGEVFLAKVASDPTRSGCDVFIWQDLVEAPAVRLKADA